MDYDVISIGAHPDDVEVGTGGVLIKLAEQGLKTGIIYLTAGEMGTGGDAAIRSSEAKAAADLMGAALLKTYDWGDTSLADSYEKRLALAEDIRKFRPRIVLCPYPKIGHGRRQSHADHVACGQIVINAVNLANLKKVAVPGERHAVARVFYYFLPPGEWPDFIVEVSAQYKRWIEVLKCHKSQFVNPEKEYDYIWLLESMARFFGLMAGVRYGQGFKADQTLLIQDLFDLAKGDRF